MRKENSNIFKIIFILLPVIYSIIYGPYGMGDDDRGFVFGLAWQYFYGAVPYSEIIYVRPPVTFMFHSLFLNFGNYAFIIDRCFSYFQIAIYSYLAIKLLAYHFKQKINSEYVYFLSGLSFILSAHTFPAMSWHTIDGVFFSVIGIYFIVRSKNPMIIFIGSIAVILAALSKQPFYITPILIMLYLILEKDIKKIYVVTVGMLSASMLFVFYLKYMGIFSEYVDLTTGSVSLHDLIIVGVLNYVFFAKNIILYFIPPALFVRKNKIISSSKYFYALFIWSFPIMMYYYIMSDYYLFPPKNFFNTLLIIVVVMAFYQIIKLKDTKYYLPVVFLGISWATSVSWGYNSPVLFSAPIVFVLGIGIYEGMMIKRKMIYPLIILILAFITFFVAMRTPYSCSLDSCNITHKQEASEQTYKMEEVFPKLKYIYGDKYVYDEYIELKQLIEEYGVNFTVLPNVTLIHYLSDTVNPIGIDWVMNAEINNNHEKFINMLEDKNVIVFLKKSKLDRKGFYGSEVAMHVRDTWLQIKAGDLFNVYQYKK